jgi:hypothetical protein
MIIHFIKESYDKALKNRKLTLSLKEKTGLEVNDFALIEYGKLKQYFTFN